MEYRIDFLIRCLVGLGQQFASLFFLSGRLSAYRDANGWGLL